MSFLGGSVVKKVLLLLVMTVLLSGCSAQQTFETVSDDQSVMLPPARQVVLQLPKDAAVTVMENDTKDKLYLCDDYTLTVHTMPSGDLGRTFRELTGFSAEALTVMHRSLNAIDCYESVWTAAGEGDDQVGRVLVMDDGQYHYAVSVMAEASRAGNLGSTWQEIFSSVMLADTDA